MGRVPSLDGWRGASITLVIAAHCTSSAGFPASIYWPFDGALGVRGFFVISGFIITHLLLREHQNTGRISLRNFYLRRSFRIFPAYFVFLAAVAMMQRGGFDLPRTAGIWLKNLTFTSNFGSAFDGISDHLWSLAVEEQFYLLWPVIFLASMRRWGSAGTLKILLIPLLLAPVARTVCYLKISPAPLRFLLSGQWSFFCCFDILAFGCLAAVVLNWRPEAVTTFVRKYLHALTWVSILTVFTIEGLRAKFLLAPLTVPVGDSLQGAALSLLILASVTERRFILYRLLNSPVLVSVGVLSYSLYLWQQPFFICSGRLVPSAALMRFPFLLLPVVAVAVCSYYLVEKPFFGLRARYK